MGTDCPTAPPPSLTCGLPDQPEDTVLEGLREDLTLRLSRVGEGAVWEHFNAYRTLNELIRAHLDADERGYRRTLYCRVVEALRADGLQQLTTEYPVLRRHLSATVASWLALSRELLLRVHRDHDILTEKFDLPLNARLIGVKTDISNPWTLRCDTHFRDSIGKASVYRLQTQRLSVSTRHFTNSYAKYRPQRLIPPLYAA